MTNIKGDISGIPGLIDNKINSLKTQISNEINQKVSSATNPIKSQINNITGDITDLGSQIGEVPELIDDAIDGVEGYAEGLVDDLKDYVNRQIQIVKDFSQGLVDDLREFTEGIVYELRQFVEEQIDQVLELIQQVKEYSKGLVDGLVERIKAFGNNIGTVVNNGIVNPFKTLFEAIGNVFLQIFNILIELGEKVKSLPGCIFIYIYQGTLDAIFGIINWILPSFITNFFKMIYALTLKIPIDFIAEWTGYNDYYDKCYNFDVKSEVNSIKQGFNEASNEFKDSFGEMNFNNIF